jgi:hypothetical protein
MRLGCVLLVLVLSACGGYRSNPGAGEQMSYSNPAPTASGGSYMRDGHYDGGIMDPDLTPRAMGLPE